MELKKKTTIQNGKIIVKLDKESSINIRKKRDYQENDYQNKTTIET